MLYLVVVTETADLKVGTENHIVSLGSEYVVSFFR